MTDNPPMIPLNELLQIDATIIAGILVLLLVTKFLRRASHPSDDSFTVPRKIVGIITPCFALSALTILIPDLFDVKWIFPIDVIARFSSFMGFVVLIATVVTLALTPEKRSDSPVKEKKSILDRIKNIFCYFCRK